MEKNHFQIVKETRINTPQSLLTLEPGETLEISCIDFMPYTTVASAVSRLNQSADWTEFSICTPDNGATIIVTRNKKEL